MNSGSHFVAFMFGMFFGTLIFGLLLSIIPPHTKYKINDRIYLVTKNDETFIKTGSIEIVSKDGILEIKEK